VTDNYATVTYLFVTKMFAGLISRWTIPFACAAGIGDLDAPIEHRLDLHRLASDSVPERLALQQFHSDEGSPVTLVNLVDRADVRVVQRGRSLGFPLETAESLCVVGEIVGKELQGDVSAELQVFSLIHNTHSAAADPAEDAVMGDRLPHGLGGRGHLVDMLGLGEGKVNVRSSGGFRVWRGGVGVASEKESGSKPALIKILELSEPNPSTRLG